VTLRGRAGYQNRQDAHNDKMPHSTARLRRMSTVLKHLDAATECLVALAFGEISLIVATRNRAAVGGTGSKK
jgi:hypothetical protein